MKKEKSPAELLVEALHKEFIKNGLEPLKEDKKTGTVVRIKEPIKEGNNHEKQSK